MSVLSRIIEEVGSFKNARENKDGEIYFRGQRTRNQLIPSLLRIKNQKREIGFYESTYYCDGWIMGASEFEKETSSWEILARFQHYQIPTRLLDWSSSLISAIYFSLENCLLCNKLECYMNDNCEGYPIIWALDPVRMHKELLVEDIRDKYAAFTIGVDEIQEYKDVFVTSEEEWKLGDVPIFIEIPWKNARISKQKGYFTFHPNDKELDKFEGSDAWLKKIKIDEDEIETLKNEINIIGVNEHDIYSDLPSLGKYFNRKFFNRKLMNITGKNP
jgi:hypothetical protein